MTVTGLAAALTSEAGAAEATPASEVKRAISNKARASMIFRSQGRLRGWFPKLVKKCLARLVHICVQEGGGSEGDDGSVPHGNNAPMTRRTGRGILIAAGR